MDREPILTNRIPTVAEYQALIAAVGWKPRDPVAVERALANSSFVVCAEHSGTTVGMGRVIGDGGLHYYLSDVVVHPDWQRRGVGTRIVTELNAWLEAIPFPNTHVGVVALRGLREFYEKLGYTAQGPEGPAMYRWVNESARLVSRRCSGPE